MWWSWHAVGFVCFCLFLWLVVRRALLLEFFVFLSFLLFLPYRASVCSVCSPSLLTLPETQQRQQQQHHHRHEHHFPTIFLTALSSPLLVLYSAACSCQLTSRHGGNDQRRRLPVRKHNDDYLAQSRRA
ncbi:hypothetical protein BC567DRAFT_227744 [Phyllosticta citribraziliensis]